MGGGRTITFTVLSLYTRPSVVIPVWQGTIELDSPYEDVGG